MVSVASAWSVPEVIGLYRVRHLLGKGSFSSVWLAEHSASGLRVAIKAVHSGLLSDPVQRTRFVREVLLMKQMDHPFIGKLYEVIEISDFICLVQEFAPCGSLLSSVNDHRYLPESIARRYFAQLVSALEYVHEGRLVVHRDIKAENVLLDENRNIRLIDFGLSHEYTMDEPTCKTACGSPAYAAPEMILGHSYTKAADIWSAGVLLYGMVVGELPFDDREGIQNLMWRIVTLEPTYPSTLSSPLIDLLKKLLVKAPEQRIDLERIKEHPWLTSSEYQYVFTMQFRSAEWLSRTLDSAVDDQIRQVGVDPRAVRTEIMAGEYTERTALYEMFRRQQITTLLKDTMDGLLVKSPMRVLIRPQRSGDTPKSAGSQWGGRVPLSRTVIPAVPQSMKIVPRPGILERKAFRCPISIVNAQPKHHEEQNEGTPNPSALINKR
jgi:serine/threonine protein kinase